MISVARLAILVGIAGLIPFIGLLAGLFFMPQYSVALLGYFYLYSAGILAFMAGVYWPIAMQLDNCSYPLSPLVTMLLSQIFFCIPSPTSASTWLMHAGCGCTGPPGICGFDFFLRQWCWSANFQQPPGSSFSTPRTD